MNEEEGVIKFGDNERGLIPPKDAEVRVIAYSTCFGSRGNVNEVYLHSDKDTEGINAYTNEIIRKGKNKETLQAAIIRFKEN